MSTLTVTLTNICSGGGHFTFTVTGDAGASKMLDRNSLVEPLDAQDVEAFIRVISRMAKMGRTPAQAHTLLQAGVVVTV